MQWENPFMRFILAHKIFQTNMPLIFFLIFLLMIYCFGAGSVILFLGRNLFVYFRPLDHDCPAQTCPLSLWVPHPVADPVYLYIGFDNFYTNHRKVMNSFSMNQLSGAINGSDTLCAGYATQAEGNRFYPQFFSANSNDTIIPCGLRSLLFNNCSVKRHCEDQTGGRVRGP